MVPSAQKQFYRSLGVLPLKLTRFSHYGQKEVFQPFQVIREPSKGGRGNWQLETPTASKGWRKQTVTSQGDC